MGFTPPRNGWSIAVLGGDRIQTLRNTPGFRLCLTALRRGFLTLEVIG